MTPSGEQVLVTCPEGSKSGDQIQFMAPATVAPSTQGGGIDPAATAQYEQWLTAATRIVIRNQGGSKKPVVETIALDVYGKTANDATGLFGTLTLEVSVDPEKKNKVLYRSKLQVDFGLSGTEKKDAAWSTIREVSPCWVFNAELKLPDGRVVMSAASAGMRHKFNTTSSLPVFPEYPNGQPRPIEMQVMDRDGPMCMTTDASTFNLVSMMCDPLAYTPKTRVMHPQSADETLRQGYQLSAPGSINGATKACRMLNLLLCVPTCCWSCFWSRCCCAPDVHFELKELRSGGAVEGARCTEQRAGALFRDPGPLSSRSSSKTCCAGYDTIDFSERVPLQVRKDTLAIAFYKCVVSAATPVFNPEGGI